MVKTMMMALQSGLYVSDSADTNDGSGVLSVC
jgi:hypothetical protein